MKRLPLLAAIVVVSLVGMVGVSRAADPAEQSVQTQLNNIKQIVSAIDTAVTALKDKVDAGVPVRQKKYYLTSETSRGDQATGACGPGFHMASLYEILDTSKLQFVKGHASAVYSVNADLGYGPPTGIRGWVRTGASSWSGPEEDYKPNCKNWTTSAPNPIHYGTAAELGFSYSPRLSYDPWRGHWFIFREDCGSLLFVWCVEDP